MPSRDDHRASEILHPCPADAPPSRRTRGYAAPSVCEHPAIHQPRRRRILYFGHTALLGGGEIALLHTLRFLDRSKYEPVVVLASDGPLRSKMADHGLPVHVLPLAPRIANTRKESLRGNLILRVGDVLAALAYVWRLAGFIRAQRVDLVHTNTLKADLIGGLAAKLAGVPVLWHVRDRIHADYLPAAAAKFFRACCALLADLVVAPSTSVMELLQPAYLRWRGASAARNLRVVHDGVIPDAFIAIPISKLHASSTIGLLGRISAFKGQHIFIEAAGLVIKKFPAVRFRIIGAALFGEQDYERQVRKRVEELGLSHAVEFVGFRSDVASALAEIDLVVHASTTGEPFGQVIVEGMAAGRPVIATDGGGVPEIVQAGITGLLVPMGDATAMADAICSLLEDPVKARQMAEFGRRTAITRFTSRHTAEKLEMVYDDFFCQRGLRTGALQQL